MIFSSIINLSFQGLFLLIDAILYLVPVLSVPPAVLTYFTTAVWWFHHFQQMADPIFPIQAQVGLMLIFVSFYSIRLIFAVVVWVLGKIPVINIH